MLIHETGHSLDLQGAYPDHPLSKSKAWLDAFAADSKVPDGYAQSRMIEDVAQSTVVAMYDLVVPGGVGKVQKHANEIWNQYFVIQKEASAAGNLLVPGGTCWRRFPNSPPVPVVDSNQRQGHNQRRALGRRRMCPCPRVLRRSPLRNTIQRKYAIIDDNNLCASVLAI